MSAPAAARSLTVRLEPGLYAAATELAKRRCVSLNALMQESLAAVVKEEEDRELYEAAELLGQHPAESDVEYAFAAQSQAVLGIEY